MNPAHPVAPVPPARPPIASRALLLRLERRRLHRRLLSALRRPAPYAMYKRVPVAGLGTDSAPWNAAHDGGVATGPIAVGLLPPTAGHPTALPLAAAVMACATVLVPRARIAPLRTLTTRSTEAV